MKKTMIFAAAAAMFMFASCQKEEVISGQKPQSDELIFTASIVDQTTRTTINTDTSSADKGKVSWEVSDEISVSDGTNTAVYYIEASDIAADGSATFTYKSGTRPSKDASSYTATYGEAITTAQTYSATAGKLPMTGTSDSGNKTKLNFTVSCGLLKLNLTALSTETDKTISEIKVFGKVNSRDAIYTLTCESVQNISSAKDFFIALPAGNYSVMKFTNSTGHIYFKTAKSAMTIEANKIQPVTLTGIVFNDILLGEFTIASGKTVQFSRGNLQATRSEAGTVTANGDNDSKWNFFFAENQWDYIGPNNVSGSAHGNTIDLFGWSSNESGKYLYGISTNTINSNYGYTKNDDTTFNDWGNISTLPGNSDSKKIWRTLTGGEAGEWDYLLSTRQVNGGKGAGKSFQRATINSDGTGVSGLIIYPDNYTSQTSVTSYTTAQWSTMESAGCVFLPVAYFRKGTEVDTSVTERGYYWSATTSKAKASSAYCLYFYSTANKYVNPTASNTRSQGQSVRLVCAAQQLFLQHRYINGMLLRLRGISFYYFYFLRIVLERYQLWNPYYHSAEGAKQSHISIGLLIGQHSVVYLNLLSI